MVMMTACWQADSQHTKQFWQDFNYRTRLLSACCKQTSVIYLSTSGKALFWATHFPLTILVSFIQHWRNQLLFGCKGWFLCSDSSLSVVCKSDWVKLKSSFNLVNRWVFWKTFWFVNLGQSTDCIFTPGCSWIRVNLQVFVLISLVFMRFKPSQLKK